MKSIMHDKSSGYCYLCARLYGDYSRKEGLHEHHVIFGRANRRLSEKYGLKVYLCIRHHTEGKEAVHHNKELRQMLEQEAQRAFLQTHTQAEWMGIFGRNFLDAGQQPEEAPHLGFKPKNENERGIILLEDEGE